MNEKLHALLRENPHLWQGKSAYKTGRDYISTGHNELDGLLPGRGWPNNALVEMIAPHWGIGELRLLVPMMRTLTHRQRWLFWICPPYQLYAPAVLNMDIDTRFIAVINDTPHETDKLWAVEQALQTQHCGLVLAWSDRYSHADLRRLQLAAERGATTGVLFSHVETKNSPAVLRLALSPTLGGIAINVIKARETFLRSAINLSLPIFPDTV